MTKSTDFYAALIIALGAIFAGAWLGCSEIVLLALALLIFTLLFEGTRP